MLRVDVSVYDPALARDHEQFLDLVHCLGAFR